MASPIYNPNSVSGSLSGVDEANKANQTRYQQGLNILKKGYKRGSGFIANALNTIKGMGQGELARINEQEQHGLSDMQQRAIGRGLGNTTIAETMRDLPIRQANDARLGLADTLARNKSNLQMAQAGQSNRRADTISSFIAAKNDTAPSLSELANLVGGAAGATEGKRTTTITKGNLSTPTFMSGGGTSISAGGGGALGSGGVLTSGSTSGGGSIPQEQSGGGGTPQTQTPQTSAPPPPPQTQTPQTSAPPPPPPPPPLTPNIPQTQTSDPSKPGYISIQWSGCSDPNIGQVQKMIHNCKGFA